MQTGQAQYPTPHPHELHGTRSAALALLLACAVLLPLLGHRPLTDWDEGIYAEIAREMLAGHNAHAWLIPHWNGALWFEKPPLQMWLTAVSFKLFGLNAFAARLPSALAGIAVVTILHNWLLRHKDLLTAWLSTILLLSAFGFQHAARVGETDTLLSLFSLLAVLGLADLLFDNPAGWILFFTGFALAVMTKGAASLTLPLTALTLSALHPRQLLRYRYTFTTGMGIFLAVALPWHIYAYTQFDQVFLRDYIGFHTLTRASSAIEGHHTYRWFYLWVLILSAPPFALLYPVALAAPFLPGGRDVNNKRPSPPRPESLQAFAVFALLVLCLFTAASTRLPHYIAPAYPALSALLAALLARSLHAYRPLGSRATLLLSSAALILYTASAFLTAKPRRSLHNPQLRDGYNTPDNRESVSLLQQLTRTPAQVPVGPLLVWRQTPIVPLTTDAFYAHRLAQQVSQSPPPANLPLDPYFNQPKPLAAFLGAPHLLLLDRALLPQLPSGAETTPVAVGPTQELVVVVPVPTPPTTAITRIDLTRPIQ